MWHTCFQFCRLLDYYWISPCRHSARSVDLMSWSCRRSVLDLSTKRFVDVRPVDAASRNRSLYTKYNFSLCTQANCTILGSLQIWPSWSSTIEKLSPLDFEKTTYNQLKQTINSRMHHGFSFKNPCMHIQHWLHKTLSVGCMHVTKCTVGIMTTPSPKIKPWVHF